MNNTILMDKSEIKFQDISFLEYLYVLILIIYGGQASAFVRSFSTDKPLAVLLPVIMSVILALRFKIVFNKQIYILLLCYLIYSFASTIKSGEFHPIFFGQMFINFLITYVTVKALKFRLFKIFEYLIYYLAIFGLAMWIIQILLGGDNLLNIISKIPSVDTFSTVSGGGLNIVLYSVQPASQVLVQNSFIPRNCGFAWEPGGFAVFLCLAIFFNLFFNKSEVKLNKRFWILLLALLSTQSTTGYVIFITIMVFYFFQSNIKIVMLFLPILIIAISFLVTLPFMRDKILLYIEEVNQVDVIVEQSIGSETTRGPQRFASFVIAFRDFKDNPILGYGGRTEERWYNKLNSNIVPITGIGNLLAQYGIVGFLFFITQLNKSSWYFSRYFNYSGTYLFLLIILLISISYGLSRPLIMSFWLFYLFTDRDLSDVEIK